jgi:hypothetical protein
MAYEQPQLQYIGKAERIVQGQENLGGDVWGMQDFHRDEFAKE